MWLKTKGIGIFSGLLVLMFIFVVSASAQTPPRPAEFVFSDLNISQTEIELGENITISFMIRNVGEPGKTDFVLNIGGPVKGCALSLRSTAIWSRLSGKSYNGGSNITVEGFMLPSTIMGIEFDSYWDIPRLILTPGQVGNYTVEIEGLEGNFTVKHPDIPPPPLSPFLSNLTITPAEIERGDNVTINLDIVNIDSQSITYAVDIHIENVNDPPPTWPPMDVYLRIWVDLEAYESKTVSHTMTMDTVGDFNVTVAGMTGSFKVGTVSPEPPLRPAELVISDLSIEPEEAELWEGIDDWTFRISVNVTNVGEQEGMDKINLRVDGSIIDQRTVKLKAGEQVTIMYDVMRGVGSYTVEVDGLTGSFVVINTLKPDEVELSELETLGRQALIHDDEGRPIVEGEYVIFSVLVINIGETKGTYTVEFKVDGETTDTYNVTLVAGRGRRALTEYEALNAGTYQISVGNLTETFTVRVPLEPAEFEFSNLQITPRVKIGQSVNISVDVTNVGEMMGFCSFDLKVNGRVVDSVEIPSFVGGMTATQFFELTRGEGTYEVEVGELTGSFTVFISEPPFWKSPEFIMGVFVIIICIVAIYVWRRWGFGDLEHMPPFHGLGAVIACA